MYIQHMNCFNFLYKITFLYEFEPALTCATATAPSTLFNKYNYTYNIQQLAPTCYNCKLSVSF